MEISDYDVLCADGDDSSLLFKHIFRSAAFKTFLTRHAFDRDGGRTVGQRPDAHGGVGIFAETSIPAGVSVLPYTGIFASSKQDNTISGRNASLHDSNATGGDRDMLIDWRLFDGKSGRKRDENGGFIRGWSAPHRWTMLGATANHRCATPNAAYVVVDLYVFFQDNDQAPWIVYASDDGVGRKINQNGNLLPRLIKRMPPLVPSSVHGDVYLISWPVIHSLRKVASGGDITVDYGDEYVAISPHHIKPTDVYDDASREYVGGMEQRWKDALAANQEKNVREIFYCCCEDCIKFTEITKRSIFLPP